MEEEDNNIFLGQMSSDESSDESSASSDDNTESDDKENWKDVGDGVGAPKTSNKSSWIDSSNLSDAKGVGLGESVVRKAWASIASFSEAVSLLMEV